MIEQSPTFRLNPDGTRVPAADPAAGAAPETVPTSTERAVIRPTGVSGPVDGKWVVRYTGGTLGTIAERGYDTEDEAWAVAETDGLVRPRPGQPGGTVE